MAFPVTNVATERAYITAKQTLLQSRNFAQSVNDQSAAGAVSGNLLLQFIDLLRAADNAIAVAEAAPGIATVAKDYEQNQTLDLSAEWATVKSAVNTLLAWLSANLPQANGYLQLETIDANGTRTVREFSSAALATLRSHLTTFVNTMT